MPRPSSCRHSWPPGAITASACSAVATRRCTISCWAPGTATPRAGRRSVTTDRLRCEPTMSRFPDPIAAGRESGWKITDASARELPERLDCDVVIVGTGAGGGITAEILVKNGLSVVLVEEGPL